MDKKSILIVGASSLLGKSFCKLFGSHYDIFTCGRNRVNDNFKHIEVDLSKELDIDKLPKKVEVVLYLAQSYKFRDFQNSADEIFKINTVRVLDFLNYSKDIGVNQFIYASTGGVYTQNKIHQEDDYIDASKLNGFYATSKYSAELLVNSYKQYFDMVILRPFFIFGEEQKLEMLIPRLIGNIKNHNPIQLQGKKGICINPIYVDDASNIVSDIIDKGVNGVFNLSGKSTIDLKELSMIIGNILNIEPIFDYQEKQGMDVIGDNTKFKHLDYTLLKNAIERVIDAI